MASGDELNLYQMQKIINDTVGDCQKMVITTLEEYTMDIEPLLPYEKMRKKDGDFHGQYKRFCEAKDKIVKAQVSLDSVLIQLADIKRSKLNRDMSNDFREMKAFKTRLDGQEDDLKTLRYDLAAVSRCYSDRLKLMQNLLYDAL
jgi:hypothetical protein